jgi:glycerol-3-phosphate dehydrogenase
MPSHSPEFDLLVIGAGINGAGIARDAAGRGLKVLIVERGDIASATSQWSTKLIHGGLRYLEQYEFRLVHESLAEREVVLRQAPHLVEPLSFVLPHEPHLRPAWMLRAGLFLYDHLGRREALHRSFGVNLSSTPWGAGLKPKFAKASSIRTPASMMRGSSCATSWMRRFTRPKSGSIRRSSRRRASVMAPTRSGGQRCAMTRAGQPRRRRRCSSTPPEIRSRRFGT